MIIKEPDYQGLILKKINSLMKPSHTIRRVVMLVFSAIFLCIVVLTSIYSGMVLEKMCWAHILKEVIQSKQGRQNYFRSFAAIPEHIDIDIKYKNFQKLAHKVPQGGFIIANADDERLKNVAKKFGDKVVWYSLQDREVGFLRKILRNPTATRSKK